MRTQQVITLSDIHFLEKTLCGQTLPLRGHFEPLPVEVFYSHFTRIKISVISVRCSNAGDEKQGGDVKVF
jgi:hypothetical protein